MKVTVSLITYNHAAFIRQAIDSVLMQQTDFDFELLIGEDASTDGTRETVAEYAAKFPEKIRVIYNRREDVIHYQGRPTGQFNFLNNILNSAGEYVALLEGDDYWTDPHKLQKQASFLDQHPECSACFNPSKMTFENGDADAVTDRRMAKYFYTTEDILRAGFFIPTCSYFFRNRLFAEFPKWIFTLPMGDMPLHILLSQHGLLGCIDEVMSVYRIHAGGYASGGSKQSKWSSEQLRNNIKMLVIFYETMGKILDKKYLPIIRDKLSMLNYDAAWSYQRDGNLSMIRHHLREAAHSALRNSQTPTSDILKAYFIAYGLYFDKVFRCWRRVFPPRNIVSIMHRQ
jgi:glycosyltransferase involved in cell wall biosynthesis